MCIVEPDAAAHRQLWRHISFEAADPSTRLKGLSNRIANAFGRGRIGRTAKILRPLPEPSEALEQCLKQAITGSTFARARRFLGHR